MLVTALKPYRTGHLNDTVAKGDTFYVSDQLGIVLISRGQVKAAPAGAKPVTATAVKAAADAAQTKANAAAKAAVVAEAAAQAAEAAEKAN